MSLGVWPWASGPWVLLGVEPDPGESVPGNGADGTQARPSPSFCAQESFLLTSKMPACPGSRFLPRAARRPGPCGAPWGTQSPGTLPHRQRRLRFRRWDLARPSSVSWFPGTPEPPPRLPGRFLGCVSPTVLTLDVACHMRGWWERELAQGFSCQRSLQRPPGPRTPIREQDVTHSHAGPKQEESHRDLGAARHGSLS